MDRARVSPHAQTPAGRLSLWVRARTPEPLKRFARGMRLLVTPNPAPAPSIPQALLDGCRLLNGREGLVAELPRAGRVCEVGTQQGRFAKLILERSAPAELHLIDLDFSALLPELRRAPGVVLHEGFSHEV